MQIKASALGGLKFREADDRLAYKGPDPVPVEQISYAMFVPGFQPMVMLVGDVAPRAILEDPPTAQDAERAGFVRLSAKVLKGHESDTAGKEAVPIHINAKKITRIEVVSMHADETVQLTVRLLHNRVPNQISRLVCEQKEVRRFFADCNQVRKLASLPEIDIIDGQSPDARGSGRSGRSRG